MMILELLHTLVLPSRTVYIMHSVVDISTMVGLVSVPKRSALETSRRELSEDVSFGIAYYCLLLALLAPSWHCRHYWHYWHY